MTTLDRNLRPEVLSSLTLTDFIELFLFCIIDTEMENYKEIAVRGHSLYCTLEAQETHNRVCLV